MAHDSAPRADVSLPNRHVTPDEWVPADERIAGFDRRTIWPAMVLLIVWALWAHVMPWINDQIAWDNPVVAGDVINLRDGEVTFVPATGWHLESGSLLGSSPAGTPKARLVDGSVSYAVAVATWSGTSDELVDRMIDLTDSDDELLLEGEQTRTVIRNIDGVSGTLVHITGVDRAVVIAAFVFETGSSAAGTSSPIGVDVEIRGNIADLDDLSDAFTSMIETTTYRPIAGGDES